jgi:hypothetical protein
MREHAAVLGNRRITVTGLADAIAQAPLEPHGFGESHPWVNTFDIPAEGSDR